MGMFRLSYLFQKKTFSNARKAKFFVSGASPWNYQEPNKDSHISVASVKVDKFEKKTRKLFLKNHIFENMLLLGLRFSIYVSKD